MSIRTCDIQEMRNKGMECMVSEYKVSPVDLNEDIFGWNKVLDGYGEIMSNGP